jgi:hypothetical protein
MLSTGIDSALCLTSRTRDNAGASNALDVWVRAAYLGLIKRIEVCGFARLAS